MSISEQLIEILSDLQGVWTESFLIVGSIFLLLFGLIKSTEWTNKVVFGCIVVGTFILNSSNQISGSLLLESLTVSAATGYFGGLFLVVALLMILFPREKKHATEFYFFILAMLVGSMFMMKSNSFLIVYLAIELVSFSSYILTNFSFKKAGFEAGIKYLLFGAISSAVMLFGLGLIYGTTHTFGVSEFIELTSVGITGQIGFLMLLFGIFFKISIVPSHVWAPATYQMAPADATAFMSIVPKLAGLILLGRVLTANFLSENHWIVSVVLILGMLTVMVGTLGAFKQSNARRMISFGAIAHSGFLLPFALINSDTSAQAFWFYAAVYSLMNIAVFYLLDQYERKKIHSVSEYSKASGAVWIGVCYTLVLVSLVGLPPLSGFFAKFFLFTTLWESYTAIENQLILWYLIVVVFATVGSLFYYLSIPKNIFLVKSGTNQSIKFELSAKIIATLFSIGLLLLFFAPKLVIVMQQLLNKVHE